MMVHVSPNEEDVGETTCSITFAKRARAVECTRELSEVHVSNVFINNNLWIETSNNIGKTPFRS